MQILARIHYRVLSFQLRLYREVVLVKSFLLLVHLIFKYPVLQHLVLAQNRTIVHVSSNGMDVCSGTEAGHQSTGPLDGDIDDFPVYSRELTSVDITKIYNS